MSSITYDKFEVGLDRRKNITVADANRLYQLKNAYVTNGKVIRKRPGLVLDNTLEGGTIGLVSGNGFLNTFYESGSITHANPKYKANKIPHPTLSQAIQRIHFGDIFSGYIYVVAEYADGSISHHYLDDPGAWAAATAYAVGTFRRPIASNGFRYEVTAVAGTGTSAGVEPVWPTVVGATVIDNPGANQITWTCRSYAITDSNCPNTKAVIKMAERIWAVAPDTVRFTKISTPRDWTTVSEAGFIATGLRARGSVEPKALGQYQERLAVFMEDGTQVWNASSVYNEITYFKPVDGVGCKHHRVPRQVSGDIMFLARSGFRSITQQTLNDNLNEIDVGSPIDSVVKIYLTDDMVPISEYFTGKGQFWCAIPDATIGSRAFVYTFSKTAKISAWSMYEFGFLIDDMVSHNASLYLRSENYVYQVDEADSVFTDNFSTYEMRIEFPFLNFKKPGSTKYISGMDVVVEGTVDVSFRYDPNDLDAVTDPITVTGDGHSKQTVPIEMTVPSLAPIFTSVSDKAVQLDSFTFHYDELGVV
jgi:hypothetical protein